MRAVEGTGPAGSVWPALSDTTLQTPRTLRPAGSGPVRPAARRGTSLPVAIVWAIVAVLLVAGSYALVRWADTRPGYDPYGWLDWGYQTIHGSLNLGGAPSWKPFTYIFTVPYALLGRHALTAWMVTAVAISLSGAIFGGRVAYRLVCTEPKDRWLPSPGGRGGATGFARTRPASRGASDGRHRWAGVAAALFAGAAVLGIQQVFHYILSAQSDPMLVAVCLAAIDQHLSGRPRWCWWLLVLGGLGRPEVWPFAFLYGLWGWFRVPSIRWMIVAGVAASAFLWFGVPTITNGRPDIAGQLALKSAHELHQNKVVGEIDRFFANNYAPIWFAALAAVVMAVLRRDLVVVALAAAAVVWVLVEIAFVLHGFPGVQRYVFEPAALAGVLAGVAFGWLLLDVGGLLRRRAGWIGIPLAAVLLGFAVPDAIADGRLEHKDIKHERLRTVEITRLGDFVRALGGPAHVRECGHPVLNVGYVSIMAWYLHMNTGNIGYLPRVELYRKTYPVVNFVNFRNGWGAFPYRTPAALQATCANMRAFYVPTAIHPGGVLVHK